MADRVVAQVVAVRLRPAAELGAEHRQHALAQDTVEPLAELLAVVTRLVQHVAERAVGQVGRREQPEQRSPVGLEGRGVELQVPGRRPGLLHPGGQQPHPRAGGEQAVRGVVRATVGQQGALRQAALLVEAGEEPRLGTGMDDDRRAAVGLAEVALWLEHLEGVAEVGQQLAPAAAIHPVH